MNEISVNLSAIVQLCDEIKELKQIIAKNKSDQFNMVLDAMTSKGLIRPQETVKLRTRKQQATYCQMPLSTYKTHILPLIDGDCLPTRGELDRALTIYKDRRNLKLRRTRKYN